MSATTAYTSTINEQDINIIILKKPPQYIWKALSLVDSATSNLYEPSYPQSSTETSKIEEVLSELSLIPILIPQPAEVRSYLLSYPDIANLLPPVCEMARERFGKFVQLSLEVYHDPEIEDEYLTLYVRQEHYDEQIMDEIEEICAAYETALIDTTGWFLVTTDFRPPR